MKNIRNFSIIAHIDHGKSTLADRFIQFCGGLSEREMSQQVLDSMDLERERGITIKAQCVTLNYQALSGESFQLNFIDTPGHVDFSYEVSRSLAAVEGALLVVDALQGVEAQSVANCYTAIEQGLEVVPVLNKMDLPGADCQRVIQQIENVIGIEASNALRVSAKTGLGVHELLESLIARIPPPKGDSSGPLAALIIDSWFDNYLGVVSLVRVVEGSLFKRQKVLVMSTGLWFEVEKLGIFTPKLTDRDVLETGEVGFVVLGLKDIFGAPVGDTLTDTKSKMIKPLAGFQTIRPRVFAGMFPVDTNDYDAFRSALAKLRLNDAALHYEPETSQALGFGFRCGFLGMLHLEIVQARLEREYELDLISTAPTVIYEILTTTGTVLTVDNPADLPEPSQITEMREPIVEANILLPPDFLGNVINLCVEKRGVQKKLHYLGSQVSLSYELPLSEMVLDFFDRLKSVSRGYASLDYSFLRFQAADLIKLDVLINGERVDALSIIVHQLKSLSRGVALVKRMKKVIPRQMFDVAIQAAIGNQIIARQTVKAFRKNVTAKCYGGDVSRKRKLLEKQKEGKKRMKKVGSVSIPQEAFLAVLRVTD